MQCKLYSQYIYEKIHRGHWGFDNNYGSHNLSSFAEVIEIDVRDKLSDVRSHHKIKK